MNADQVAQLAETTARNMTDKELCEQAVVLAIYARAIHDECTRRSSQTSLLNTEPAGHA